MMFKCPHCLYRSDKKHLYLGHIRSHTGEKPFKCRYCDYRCAQSGNRLVHERLVHGYWYHSLFAQISTLAVSFRQEASLLGSHQVTHWKKPFKCRYCDYRCTQSGNRLVHETVVWYWYHSLFVTIHYKRARKSAST